MAVSAPADGQIVATIIELLDRNPRPDARFGAPAISFPHLAATLRTSTSFLSATRAADLIRPLSESLFDRPREPVVRTVRRGLSKEEWIVFEGVLKPVIDFPIQAPTHPSPRPSIPRTGTAPSTPTRSTSILPRPPMRQVRSSERIAPPIQETLRPLASSTLHLIPTLPGVDDRPPMPSQTKEKGEKVFMPGLGLTQMPEPGPGVGASSEKAGKRNSLVAPLGDADMENEGNTRKTSVIGPGKKQVFDPMRDMPPPISQIVREPQGGGLLAVPNARERNGREQKQQQEDDDSTFNIISAYEDGEGGGAGDNGVEGRIIKDTERGTVPPPKEGGTRDDSKRRGDAYSVAALRTSKSDTSDEEDDEPFGDGDGERSAGSGTQSARNQRTEMSEGGGDGVNSESEQSSSQRDVQSGYVSEAQSEVPSRRGKKDDGDDISDGDAGRRGSGDNRLKHRHKPRSPDGTILRREADGPNARRNHKHKDKHQLRYPGEKDEGQKYQNQVSPQERMLARESVRREDALPTPWLVTAFEGLPFGPDAEEFDMSGWLRERWRLIGAQVIAILGVVYVPQASGL